MRIRIATYSTKPRGGVVHALHLSEALGRPGPRRRALGPLGRRRRASSASRACRPTWCRWSAAPGEDVEPRILRYAAALADGLRAAGAGRRPPRRGLPVGPLAAGAARRGPRHAVVRTVHHVDDFASPYSRSASARRSRTSTTASASPASGPTARRRLRGRERDVVPNGVDGGRFAACPLDRAAAGGRLGWGDRPTVLAIGGIEPRKGSRTLLEAFARAPRPARRGRAARVAGGETLFDYADYRAAWREDAVRLGLRVHDGPAPPDDADVAVLGTIADDEMPALYRAADVLAFPSDARGLRPGGDGGPRRRPARRGERPAGLPRAPGGRPRLPDVPGGRLRRPWPRRSCAPCTRSRLRARLARAGARPPAATAGRPPPRPTSGSTGGSLRAG